MTFVMDVVVVVVIIVASLNNPSLGDQYCSTHNMLCNHQIGLCHSEHTAVRAASVATAVQKVMVSASSAMAIPVVV